MAKKRILVMVLAVLMMGLSIGSVQAAAPAVLLDGQQVSFDVQPVIDNNRTLVPLRAIFEALGAAVSWDESSKTVSASKGATNIRLQIGNQTAYQNGNSVHLDVPAKIVSNRTMVPLRFVGEALNCTVGWNETTKVVEISSKGTQPTAVSQSGYMKAHIIDVGQGDAILIQLSSGKNILIDAGTGSQSVISYLKNNHVSRLDVVIATHPHNDHIGGMADVIQAFDVGKIYMPRVSHTTKTYSNLITAIQNKGLKATEAKAGVSIDVGTEFKATLLAPNSATYDDLNNYSAVLKMDYGKTSFLFTGDAEDVSEKEMLEAGFNLQSDLLKVGHHGSNSSSTSSFLQNVHPSYAVISVGTGNDYGHPANDTINRIQSTGAKVFRTDQQGTIIATSDGNSVSVNKEPSSVTANTETPISNTLESTFVVAPATAASSTQYIGNKNSKKFHLPTCRSLPAPQNQIIFDSREEAIKQGFTPCGLCKP